MQQHLASRLAGRLALIDEDCGQLEAVAEKDEAGQYGVPFPCVLISPVEVEWTAPKSLPQRGRATLTVRLACDATDSATTAHRLQLAADVHAAIHGWTFEGCNGPMRRTHSRQFSRKGGIKVYETTYVAPVDE